MLRRRFEEFLGRIFGGFGVLELKENLNEKSF